MEKIKDSIQFDTETDVIYSGLKISGPIIDMYCGTTGGILLRDMGFRRFFVDHKHTTFGSLKIAKNSTYGTYAYGDFTVSLPGSEYLEYLSAGNILDEIPKEVKEISLIMNGEYTTFENAVCGGYFSFTSREVMEILQKIKEIYKIRILRFPEVKGDISTTSRGKITISELFEETMLEEESEIDLRSFFKKIKNGVTPQWVKIK